MPDVELATDVRRAILGHARAALPNECCGLLLGSPSASGGTVHVRRVHPARNLADSPTGYQVDPQDHFAAIREARRQGWEVVGAYHSHPGAPPTPSRRDLAEVFSPAFVYVIVSVPTAGSGGARCRIAAYLMDEGGSRRLRLRTDRSAKLAAAAAQSDG